MRVRALMVPPGVPDFFSRHRLVDAGRGRAGRSRLVGRRAGHRVEVGVDGTWSDAAAGRATGGVRVAWLALPLASASPASTSIGCRATDAAGNVQPLEQPWNTQGMGNNSVQAVAVTVR